MALILSRRNAYRMPSNVCYTYTGIQVVDFSPQQLMKGEKINQIYIMQINEDYFSKDCQCTVKKS
jgi:hypothetical protein